jgi:hypothetical protein
MSKNEWSYTFTLHTPSWRDAVKKAQGQFYLHFNWSNFVVDYDDDDDDDDDIYSLLRVQQSFRSEVKSQVRTYLVMINWLITGSAHLGPRGRGQEMSVERSWIYDLEDKVQG